MTRHGNLPIEMNSFVGRAAELDEIAKLLDRGRLLTLHGAGGVGKTRLALQAARMLRDDHPDGVWLAEFSAETDGDRLAGVVAGAFGLHEATGRPILDSLVDFLSGRRLLLVLDACEHLVGPCAAVVSALLAGAPDIRIMVTSRQELGLPEEVVLAVEPFPVPPPEAADLAGYDAMSLFLDRATAVAPGLRTDERAMMAVARLCRRLDGMPLAIELAASHMRALSATQLADQFENRFASSPGGVGMLLRHTLSAATAWSHELCTPAERLLWARLSVFAGAFGTESARGVCEDESLPDVPAVLASLAAKSVVTRVGDRYRLLDTIRDYGRDRLDELGETVPMTHRHRDHYLSAALRMSVRWFGPDQLEWADWAYGELRDIRAALDRCLDSGDPRTGLELAGALRVLWCHLGLVREGRRYLDRALAAVPGPDRTRSRPLWVAAHLAIIQGDMPLARARAEEALESARLHGDVEAEAEAQLRLAGTDLLAGDLEGAVKHVLRGARRLRRVRKDAHAVLLLPLLLAVIATFDGDLDQAVGILRATRRRCEELGELCQRAMGDYVLSLALYNRGEVAEASAAARAALEVKWRLRDTVGSVLAIGQLARTAVAEGDGRRAAWLLGAARRIWITFGLPGQGVDSVFELREAAANRAAALIGEAAYARAFEEGAAAHYDAAVAYALGR
ncbi:NB-ARC domain-containing protein [Streptosporangium sp. NPDC023615]|uniref:ATP-binding protein n=1 Tax=Streptosporangium sp. NPDC023615 TaxID=3154794 RepID=UPI003418A1A0